jgi:hypothetical protein
LGLFAALGPALARSRAVPRALTKKKKKKKKKILPKNPYLDSVDMGTADEIALDVLINSLVGLSRDVAALRTVYVGGENSDWPLAAPPAAADERGGRENEGDAAQGYRFEDDDDDDDASPPATSARPRRRPRGSAATARGVWPFEDGAGGLEEEEEGEQGEDSRSSSAADDADPYAGIGAGVGAAPRVGMDPMRAPSGLDAELELAEELVAEAEVARQQQRRQQDAGKQQQQQQQGGGLFAPEDFARRPTRRRNSSSNKGA